MTHISINDNGQVRTISLNRPDALNAFTPAMLHELQTALNEAESDSNVNVVIIKGEGRAFSAGVDLKVLQGVEPQSGKIGNIFDDVANGITKSLRQFNFPVIAQVHGACFTGALEIALSCDFILTCDGTKFGDTHAQWGLRPTWGMAQNLARAVGVRRARQLSYSAAVFSGVDAVTWGLANESLATPEGLEERTKELAQQIAKASPGAVNAYKKLYQLSEENLPLEEALQSENALEFSEITDTVARLKGFGS
ncbi:MAG: enoyl-CoA hydratase/isomerase family protein [Gammaproteobacteria bacterium]|nr:enoyl-CoA hydratase/isomerase family protein [Gammaproteobacteria bacterium]